MNIFKNIRFVLFGLMVIGCFANFAQNEYGRTIIYISEFLIGLTLLVEAFIFKGTRWEKVFLFAESFLLGIILIAFSQIDNSMIFMRLVSLFALLFFILLYFSYAVRCLVKEMKKGPLLTILMFWYVCAAVIALVGLSFKLAHWPGANLMMRIAFFSLLGFIILMISKVRFSYQGEKITTRQRIDILPGKIRLTFLYFSIWSAYITLAMYGVVPNFYSLSAPPAAEKLKQVSLERSDIYWDNYSNFFENLRKSEEK
jgi:hypothetical protein